MPSGIYVRTAATRATLSSANMGKTLSPETRAKMSASRMGNTNQLGYHPSIETRMKLSAAHTGHPFYGNGEPRKGSLSPCWTGGKRVTAHKQKAKRRGFGYVHLNSWFPGCEGHHIDNEQVINMPKALHHSIYHNQRTGRGMAKMNALAYNFLFKQEVEAAMAGATA